jgi:4a-hydroxytetrahydrobiopterin dehydratase
MQILSESALSAALAGLDGWVVLNGKLRQEFRFPDFAHAFGFMAAVAAVAEGMNHHPEWSNVWNRVVVDLSTHDAGGITELDVTLAVKMSQLAAKLSK